MAIPAGVELSLPELFTIIVGFQIGLQLAPSLFCNVLFVVSIPLKRFPDIPA